MCLRCSAVQPFYRDSLVKLTWKWYNDGLKSVNVVQMAQDGALGKVLPWQHAPPSQ